ncbi:T9SS type A sorting domain-containing protein [Chryseobacterium sp. Tr-659]|uniref:T9SS type A sorting domain-containing protein n=1 Tax=Chryseobacterium sp. Tr-659 TaxID=2608340 RepID=UPI001422E276|nr:T9SS type A sorting domain-containing protein [Chryseobacterium sp. Tr-659]NIF06258.1 T9SS type A sorting domain-containing protein [Chryseobacterium sp. Tr-659]
MKKTLTKILRSSNSFLREGKTSLFLLLAVLCSGVLSAQFVPVNPSGTKVNVIRQDGATSLNIPGYVPSAVSLEFKTGTIVESKSFPQGQVTTHNYLLPDVFTTIGQPPIVRTFKVYFPNPGLTSRYYPIPMAIGGSTTIIPGCWTAEMDRGLFYYIGPNGSYGYGVTLTRTTSTEFLLQCTKFLCYICDNPCPPIVSTMGKSNRTEQNKAKLYPNPSSGFSELEYTASGRETITVMVTDIAGKTLYGYKTDIEAGVNKLPIDLQKGLAGTYYVNWSSSNGNAGSLPIIKK